MAGNASKEGCMPVSDDSPPLICPSFPEARQILFRSFLLSQGLSDLQVLLLRYAALAYPSWRLSLGECQALRATLTRQCAAFVSSRFHSPLGHVTEQEVQKEVGRQIDTLVLAQNAGEPINREPLLADILNLIVVRDY